MAYVKQNFRPGSVLSAKQMNHIEDGLEKALIPEDRTELQTTKNLLEDSYIYWNSVWSNAPLVSRLISPNETLVLVEMNGTKTGNYITSPLIKLDLSKKNRLLFSGSNSAARNLTIYNSAGEYLLRTNYNNHVFEGGLGQGSIDNFFATDDNATLYPNLYGNLSQKDMIFDEDTVKEWNQICIASGDANVVEYNYEGTVYITFTYATSSSRPEDEAEWETWVKKESLTATLEEITTSDIYRLPELAIPKSKYFESQMMTDVIDEIGAFNKAFGRTKEKKIVSKKTTVYSQSMTSDFYPEAYQNYYLGGGMTIVDFDAPTYNGGLIAYNGYQITRPIPLDLTDDDVTYTCSGYLRHYGFYDEDGKQLYYNQNGSNIALTKDYFSSINVNPSLVKWLVVSNTGNNISGFKVTAVSIKTVTTYELPNLQLTSDQAAGGGGASTGASNVIDLYNVDRIVAIGDSYTESHFTIKDKAWISKVSLLSDYNYDNFAVSGDTYRGQLNKIRTGTYTYAKTSGITWESLHPTHAILIAKTNDTKYMDCQQFIYDMIATIETTKGMGAIPIIASEYHVSGHDYVQTGFDYYAKKYGGYYIDLTEKDYTLRGTDYAPFWGGSHPGTRTNHLFSDTITNYIQKNLPRPYSSIKIFRARDNSKTADLDSYLFGNIEERAEKFKEISLCHSALTNSSDYDNCTNKPQGRVESEYFKIMTGNSVSFDKICLVDVILPTTVHDITEVKLITNELDGVNCYVKDVLASPYPSPAFCRRFDIPGVLSSEQVAIGNKYTSDKTTGATYTVIEILYDQVESDNGFVDGTILICKGNTSTTAYNGSTLTLTSGTGDATLNCAYEAVGLSSDYPAGKQDIGHWVQPDNFGIVDGELLKRSMDCDKISFLLVSDSTFNLKELSVEFKGNITKTRTAPVYYDGLAASCYNSQTALNAHRTFDSSNISYWLNNTMTACGLTPTTPADKVMPKNISAIVTLNPEDGVILQQFGSTTTGLTHNINHKIKVWARYFPDIFDADTQVYPDEAPITDDSFDWAKLNIMLYDSATSAKNNTTVKMPKLVGLHWTEIELDITLPPVVKTWYVGLSVEDKPIQLAMCEVV